MNFWVLWGLTITASAQTGEVLSLRVSEEMTPAGGVAQVKVSMTEPKPIVRSSFFESFDDAYFGDFLGISAAGQTGVAQYRNDKLRLELSSPGPVLPPNDYPMVTIAVTTNPLLATGRIAAVSLDLAQSAWIGADGLAYLEEAKTGSVTIGGSFYISDVIPGGGTIPAGGRYRVLGRGFTSDLRARAEDSKLVSVSPTEFVMEAKKAMQLDGLRITADQGKERVTYFSYLRGVPMAPSAHPALQNMKPVFSTEVARTATAALLPEEGMVNAIGLQNPTASAGEIRLGAYSLFGEKLAEAIVLLPGRQELLRTAEELFDRALPVGTASLRADSATAFRLTVAQVSADGASITVPAVVVLQPSSY
ncbi:MAG: hypothetical protein JNK87_23485 [Bryobacterales bacterium]|nr:hypothetical protein [Bryobacterales bacterium]